MSVDLEPLHCYLQLTEEYLENCNMEEAENHCFAASNKEAAKPGGSAPYQHNTEHGTNILESQHFEMQGLMSHVVTSAL